jgi:phosphate transport system substrate-binding protein
MRLSTLSQAAVAAITVVVAATACGSTDSGSGNNAGTPGAGQTQAVIGADQICGKGGGSRPGYQNTIGKIAGAKSELSGAGSTFVAPMMSVWTKDYSSQGVKVAYQSIGSGGGVKQIGAKTVDFGASDTPMKDSELASAKGGPIVHIPLVLGAVVPTYKVQGVSSGLKFTGDLLGKIFAGEVTKWNDPAIAQQNQGTTLPDEPIAVVHRSDGSGTTAVFTDYLTKASPSWVSKLGGADRSKGKEVAWPTGIGGKGNEGISGQVNQTEGAIGYVELAYALAQNLPYGLVQNKAGKFIQPCIDTVAAASDGAQFPADLRTSLTDEPGADAYPITGTTYALVYQNQTDKATAAALVQFFGWVLTSGQDEAASINYAPLGKTLQQLSVSQLKKITLGGQPLVRS